MNVFLNQNMITFSVSVCFERLAMFFAIILIRLGTKEYSGVLYGYHLLHVTMKLFSLK